MSKKNSGRKPAEATLEARLSSILQGLFPGVDVENQTTFAIKLGRKTIEIDGLGRRAGGRADILLRQAGRPLAVVELKAPGEPIDDAVRSQALSYARLLDPMAPLAIVTNGRDTVVYRSFDGTRLDDPSLDAGRIRALFADAAALADATYDEAVRDLLDRDGAVFCDLLAAASRGALDGLTGDIADLARPVARGFAIPRTVVGRIAASVRGTKPLTALIGPASSGRTNVLAQFCASDEVATIYIDAAGARHGLIRTMANVVGAGLFRTIGDEGIRLWLIGRLGRSATRPVAIVVDGLEAGSGERVREDLSELLQLSEGADLSIVAAMDDAWFGELSEDRFGRPTPLGRRADRIDLEPLSYDEFRTGAGILADGHGVALDRGAEFNADFREPRILRLIAASRPRDRLRPPEEAGRLHSYWRCPTILGPKFLDDAWARLGNRHTRDDLRKFARAVLVLDGPAVRDRSGLLRTTGSGVLPLDRAEDALGSERIGRLVSSGLVSYLSSSDDATLLHVRVPELLAKAGSLVLGDLLLESRVAGEDDADDLRTMLLDGCRRLPLEDLVGAAALRDLAAGDGARAAWLTATLARERPKVLQIPAGATVEMRVGGGGTMRWEVPPGGGGPSIADELPFQILSHLVAMPIRARPGEGDGDWNVELAVEVGSFPHVLTRFDPRSRELLGLETVPLPDGGSAVSPDAGVVEPITDSIVRLLRDPRIGARAARLMEVLARRATQAPPRYALVARLATALGILAGSEGSVAAAAEETRRDILGPFLDRLADGGRE